MPAERFTFTIDKMDDQAIVAMDCGKGMFRARNMPLTYLETLIDVCKQAKDRIIEAVRVDAEALEKLPTFPGCVSLGGGNAGPCDVDVTGWKSEMGEAEFGVALYDEGDDSAPALLLINEQLDDFIAKATHILTPEHLN